MSEELPRSFKIVTVWLLVGVLLFLGVKGWQHRAQQARFSTSGDVIEIRRGPDGHYHWPGAIEGRAVDFLVDTGATGTAISSALARDLGLRAIDTVQSSTAGGVVTGEVVRADIVLRGGFRADRLPVVALQGLSDRPLLGMDVLGRLKWQQVDGVLRIDLRPPGTR
jgi:aspartyl protease family protein